MSLLLRLARDTRQYFRFPGNCYACFRGVYETLEAAVADAPQTKPLGYDHVVLAEEYTYNLPTRVEAFDYPVLFWLQPLIAPDLRIFDLGGNVGVHFYVYERYLAYPSDLRWTVCDVPAIMAAGQALAATKGRRQLGWTTDIADADGADILLGSGSIQYIASLADLLATLPTKPRHLLLNRLPLYEGAQFVTLQNGGQVFYPQYVFNRRDFIHSLQALGYELVDVWKDTVDSCRIPFHWNRSLPYYHGLYLKLQV